MILFMNACMLIKEKKEKKGEEEGTRKGREKKRNVDQGWRRDLMVMAVQFSHPKFNVSDGENLFPKIGIQLQKFLRKSPFLNYPKILLYLHLT